MPCFIYLGTNTAIKKKKKKKNRVSQLTKDAPSHGEKIREVSRNVNENKSKSKLIAQFSHGRMKKRFFVREEK